jgi:hypothetical protein
MAKTDDGGFYKNKYKRILKKEKNFTVRAGDGRWIGVGVIVCFSSLFKRGRGRTRFCNVSGHFSVLLVQRQQF